MFHHKYKFVILFFLLACNGKCKKQECEKDGLVVIPVNETHGYCRGKKLKNYHWRVCKRIITFFHMTTKNCLNI